MGSVEEQNMVLGYRELRMIVGVLGFTYPFLLPVYCIVTGNFRTPEPSVSAYYHTAAHDLFVGVLCAIAVFFFAYKGHTRENHWDSRAGNLACVFALGVALFPTAYLHPEVPQWVGRVHGVASAALFVTLACFSLFLFTKTNKSKANLGRKKKQRNFVYRFCGWLIFLCIGLIGAYKYFGWSGLSIVGLPFVYTLEAIALVAFGSSWLIKGELLLRD